MLIYEYKLRLSSAQAVAIDEANRTTQYMRNECVRLWMTGRGVTAHDLQALCSRLAHEHTFATRVNSHAHQAAAARAWIERYFTNCREQRDCRSHDCRSVEYKQTGWQTAWQLDARGRRLTLTDGGGIRHVQSIGSRDLSTFPVDHIKRVGPLRRADGYYPQFVLGVKRWVKRRIQHAPPGIGPSSRMEPASAISTPCSSAAATPAWFAPCLLSRPHHRGHDLA